MKNLFTLRDVVFGDVALPPLLEIEQGQTTFICGKSGHGKSTLLKLLNGMISADSGVVLYLDKVVEHYDPILLRQEVPLCRQATYLFEGSVRENFEQFYKYRELPLPSDTEMHRYLAVCAANFELSADCDLMSGGERHRVYLAICLSFQPKILLLDEPTSALDDTTAFEVLSGITDFCKDSKIDLIIVSHNSTLTESFADVIIRLDKS